VSSLWDVIEEGDNQEGRWKEEMPSSDEDDSGLDSPLARNDDSLEAATNTAWERWGLERTPPIETAWDPRLRELEQPPPSVQAPSESPALKRRSQSNPPTSRRFPSPFAAFQRGGSFGFLSRGTFLSQVVGKSKRWASLARGRGLDD
jgi:hypothetical protein